MLYVPVVSSTGKPLMPCHPARARELVRSSKAVRRFDRGLFYIRLTNRVDGEVQVVTVVIDPGSKQEGFTVKSEAHTYLNIQADAVDWVSDHVKPAGSCDEPDVTATPRAAPRASTDPVGRWLRAPRRGGNGSCAFAAG